MKLLLVDDQALFLEGLQNLLSARGLEVVGTASDGFEALAKARQLRPDVILMDIQMPRCNGLEATRSIKAEMPDTKIVMLTVSAEDEDLFEAIKAGASGYLLKSLDAQQFFELLSNLDHPSRGEREPGPEGQPDRLLKEIAPRTVGAGRIGLAREEGRKMLAQNLGSDSPRGHSLEEMAIYQEIVNNGLAATGASVVVLVRCDHDSLDVDFVAWAGLNSGPVQKALAAARAVFPHFDPTRISVKADVNHCNREAYLEGKFVFATVQEMAEGVIDPHIIRIASALAGIRYSFLCPLKVEDQIEGSVSFHTTDLLSFSQRRTCEAFARLASLTLENAHLVDALQKQLREVQLSRQQLTRADERLRRSIAEMLHGRVQTKLLMAWHRMGDCDRLMESDPSRARSLLAELRDEIDQIREQEIRRASHLLHPSIIKVGLVPALRSLVDSFESCFQIATEVDPHLAQLDDPLHNGIPEPLRLVAYRVLEEALNNAYRHAGASHIRISLDIDDQQQLGVEVEDDGRGFDPEKVKLGLGLSSIAGRVDQAGGSWKIYSRPGQGTWLSVHLPIRSNE